jgi:hypothetical protein
MKLSIPFTGLSLALALLKIFVAPDMPWNIVLLPMVFGVVISFLLSLRSLKK